MKLDLTKQFLIYLKFLHFLSQKVSLKMCFGFKFHLADKRINTKETLKAKEFLKGENHRIKLP